MTKAEKILDGVGVWTAFYRSNIHRFCEDYLHIKLCLFQKILLVLMNSCTTGVFIGCRGIGKSFLSALYVVCKCILYPETKICIVSGTRGQAIGVLEKIITELMPNSIELRHEIDNYKLNNTEGTIQFKNGSYIKVVSASDNARGNRANILLIDEFRMVSKETIDTVLRKFLTLRRRPKYNALTNKERNKEYDKEKNITLYLSSAYWSSHWSFDKCKETFKVMCNDKRHQFVVSLPYQLSIRDGLLDRTLIEEEMLEPDFNEITFSMEYEGLFYGSNQNNFFDFISISKNRKVKYPMVPDQLANKLGDSKAIRIPPKQNGEIRLLSADIALMSSGRNKNDATSIFINSMQPTKAGRYVSNIVYSTSSEGLRTNEQALIIRRLFDEYSCDYIVLDTNGIGLGVYDVLAGEIADEERGEIYPALSCCNNKEMADRCIDPNAERVIWSIKASAQFNSDIALMLREGFKSGRVRLLIDEYDADESLKELKGYSALSPSDKLKFKMPYIETTLLIDELTRLKHDETNGKVRVHEQSGMRKDRYSSLAYNYYVALQLEQKTRKKNSKITGEDMFVIKPPTTKGGYRSGYYGSKQKRGRNWKSGF